MDRLFACRSDSIHSCSSSLHFGACAKQPGVGGSGRLSRCLGYKHGNWSRRLSLSVQCDARRHHGGDVHPDGAEDANRRTLLLTTLAGAMSAAASFPSTRDAVLAAPVQPPDLQQCRETPINGVDCCLPVSTTITEFEMPIDPTVRTRRPAHAATKQYIAQYEDAYRLLLKLPASDPRQFAQQANVHCAFCDSAYVEKGSSIEYQVHNSWLFFPWHRWFLYFHERILGSVLKDPDFALPFWNWDSPSGSTLPPMYATPSSPLYDVNRNPLHLPPAIVDLNYNLTESGLSAAAQLAANDTLMYRQFVSGSKTPSLFFGQPIRRGDVASPGGGTVENIPHGTVHVWTGNPANANDEDMGALYSAARDPSFFAHHANLDRLWEVWKGLGGRRQDITDPDWLNATFLFYDENANLVRVRIGDALDTKKLGYMYEDVPNGWVSKKPNIFKRILGKKSIATTITSEKSIGGHKQSPRIDTIASIDDDDDANLALRKAFFPFDAKIAPFFNSAHGPTRREVGMATSGGSGSMSQHPHHHKKEGLEEFKERGSKKVDKAISMLVKRPKKVRADDYEEEILVFQGVEVPTDEKVKFDVYINLSKEELEEVESEASDERKGRCDIAEYAGSFFNIPHLGKRPTASGAKVRKSDFKLGIGEVLKELGLEDEDSFILTVVPRTSHASFPISIHNVILEYE